MDILSERVGLSRNACWRRVKQMEDADVIRGRVALLDPDAVGVGLLVFVMIKTNDHAPDWLLKFEGAVRNMPEIVGAHRMSGELDYILRVRVANVKGYDVFYQRLIARVPISDIHLALLWMTLKIQQNYRSVFDVKSGPSYFIKMGPNFRPHFVYSFHQISSCSTCQIQLDAVCAHSEGLRPF